MDLEDAGSRSGLPPHIAQVICGHKTIGTTIGYKAGQITNDKPPLFRSGDILIRRGAASIRANSGDVRRPFTNSVVHEERVRAVNELWGWRSFR
jgi:hypothetical protein